jgi:hypothetical protein
MDLFGYIKLGRLKKNIADQINRKPADIFIEYDDLLHIEQRRGNYLKSINLNPLSYVQTIINGYTEIREGKDGSLLLVAYIEENDYKNVAVIELNFIANFSMYLVKTAMPREKGMRAHEVLLWQK